MHHEMFRPLSSFSATACLWGMAAHLWPAHGLDVETVAALLGGAGTFLFGVVAASKEVRAWLDRRASRVHRTVYLSGGPDAPAPAWLPPTEPPFRAPGSISLRRTGPDIVPFVPRDVPKRGDGPA